MPDPRVPVEAIRREAELARDATSLRAVAREVGITPMGLRYFLLSQGKPYAPTLRKLNEWYARRMAARTDAGEHEVRAALAILAGLYPERDRGPLVMGVLGLLEERFRAIQMPLPGWLDAIRGEWAGAGG